MSLLTALLWVIIAAAYLIRPALSGTPISLLQWIIPQLMLGNAAVIIWLGHNLRNGRKLFYYLSLLSLLFNILLTITDDFGISRLLYLGYAGALFVALLLSKKKFITTRY